MEDIDDNVKVEKQIFSCLRDSLTLLFYDTLKHHTSNTLFSNFCTTLKNLLL